MHTFAKIFEFAASAGSLEGYVYHKQKTDIDVETLPNWIDNLLAAYEHLPSEVREEIQPSCDQTLGRAIRSLIPLLSENHDIIRKLKSMVKGSLPESADDFQKKKWFR